MLLANCLNEFGKKKVYYGKVDLNIFVRPSIPSPEFILNSSLISLLMIYFRVLYLIIFTTQTLINVKAEISSNLPCGPRCGLSVESVLNVDMNQ